MGIVMWISGKRIIAGVVWYIMKVLDLIVLVPMAGMTVKDYFPAIGLVISSDTGHLYRSWHDYSAKILLFK